MIARVRASRGRAPNPDRCSSWLARCPRRPACTGEPDRVRRCGEREGRHDDLVPRADADRPSGGRGGGPRATVHRRDGVDSTSASLNSRSKARPPAPVRGPPDARTASTARRSSMPMIGLAAGTKSRSVMVAVIRPPRSLSPRSTKRSPDAGHSSIASSMRTSCAPERRPSRSAARARRPPTRGRARPRRRRLRPPPSPSARCAPVRRTRPPAPIDAPCSTTTAEACQSSARLTVPSGSQHGGRGHWVTMAPGPTKTPVTDHGRAVEERSVLHLGARADPHARTDGDTASVRVSAPMLALDSTWDWFQTRTPSARTALLATTASVAMNAAGGAGRFPFMEVYPSSSRRARCSEDIASHVCISSVRRKDGCR